jgi:hypothetical protein
MILEPSNQEHNNNTDTVYRSQQQQRDSTHTTFIIIRATVVLVGLTGVVLNSIFGFVLPNTNVSCIMDYSFEWTASINSFFAKDQYSKFLLLILSSICVDLVMVMLGLFWVMFGKSWRVILSLAIFYFSKFIIQFIFQEKLPDGYIWENPGFPSLMVSYLTTNTLFFSTAVGFLLIAALEFWKLDNYFLFGISIASLLLEIFTCNVLRANYIIDIVSALVLAHFIFILVDEICPKYLDNSNSEWFNLESHLDTNTKEGYVPLNNSDKEKL